MEEGGGGGGGGGGGAGGASVRSRVSPRETSDGVGWPSVFAEVGRGRGVERGGKKKLRFFGRIPPTASSFSRVKKAGDDEAGKEEEEEEENTGRSAFEDPPPFPRVGLRGRGREVERGETSGAVVWCRVPRSGAAVGGTYTISYPNDLHASWVCFCTPHDTEGGWRSGEAFPS